jgi:hypothetical protein
MLRSVYDFRRFTIAATDGNLGRVGDSMTETGPCAVWRWMPTTGFRAIECSSLRCRSDRPLSFGAHVPVASERLRALGVAGLEHRDAR